MTRLLAYVRWKIPWLKWIEEKTLFSQNSFSLYDIRVMKSDLNSNLISNSSPTLYVSNRNQEPPLVMLSLPIFN
jgi:hypothetical protein